MQGETIKNSAVPFKQRAPHAIRLGPIILTIVSKYLSETQV